MIPHITRNDFCPAQFGWPGGMNVKQGPSEESVSGIDDYTAPADKNVYPIDINKKWDNGKCPECDGSFKYIVDLTTGEIYQNQTRAQIREIFFQQIVETVYRGALILIADVAMRALAVCSFQHFYSDKYKGCTLQERVVAWGIDLLRIGLTPLTWIAMEAINIAGVVHPEQGQKAWRTLLKLIDLNPRLLQAADPFSHLWAQHRVHHFTDEITLNDFCPWNTWTVPEWNSESRQDHYLVISDGHRNYFDDYPWLIRIKGIELALLGTPMIQTLAMIEKVVDLAIRILSLSHFWIDVERGKPYQLTHRLKNVGQDLLRLVLAPIVLVGLELAAIYMVLNPLDGRKIYATLGRVVHGRSFLFLCLQVGYMPRKKACRAENDLLERAGDLLCSASPPSVLGRTHHPKSDASIPYLPVSRPFFYDIGFDPRVSVDGNTYLEAQPPLTEVVMPPNSAHPTEISRIRSLQATEEQWARDVFQGLVMSYDPNDAEGQRNAMDANQAGTPYQEYHFFEQAGELYRHYHPDAQLPPRIFPAELLKSLHAFNKPQDAELNAEKVNQDAARIKAWGFEALTGGKEIVERQREFRENPGRVEAAENLKKASRALRSELRTLPEADIRAGRTGELRRCLDTFKTRWDAYVVSHALLERSYGVFSQHNPFQPLYEQMPTYRHLQLEVAREGDMLSDEVVDKLYAFSDRSPTTTACRNKALEVFAEYSDN